MDDPDASVEALARSLVAAAIIAEEYAVKPGASVKQMISDLICEVDRDAHRSAIYDQERGQ